MMPLHVRGLHASLVQVLLHMRGLYDPMKPQMVGRRLSALKACAQKGEQALLPYLEKIDDIYCRLFEAAHAGSYNHVAGQLLAMIHLNTMPHQDAASYQSLQG
eukprot:1142881-Pelagomonas_calceolata.AAC.1